MVYLKKIPPILPAVTWFVITTVLLSLPGSAFPKAHWFDKIWLDKWVHIGLFALLAFFWAGTARNVYVENNRRIVHIALYCLLYGIAMEFVQKYFIPNRSFEVGDILADGAGSALGAFLSTKWYIKK